VKNCERRAADIASNEASSAQVTQKSKFRLSRKFLYFTASALICASLGLTQSVKADGALTVAGIQSVLQGEPQALKSQQATQASQQDDAVSALSSFAQQIGAPDAKFDDQAFAALQDFAQRLGTAQPQSIKALPKVAEAKSLLEFLQQGGSSSQSEPAAPPKGSAAGGKRTSAPVEAHFVGAKACLTCHAKQTAEFERTLMGKIGKTQKGKFECENCHGPGSAHVKAGGGRGVGGILSFGKDDPRSIEERNGLCLGCHQKGERNYWAGSIHETRGVACTNCHTVMKDVSRKHALKTEVEAETCYQCHQLKRAQMQYSSHMPIREGKVTCSNCHNPHGSITEKLIREASVNDNCYKCHAEKRGPYLWEHAPVRESCLNCHKPHGSNYEYLLQVARPRLCNECHTAVHNPTASGGFGFPNTAYVLGRACGNCHSNIHGSNHPNGMLFLR
jgi:DmsE family decaheme c-type cytochrome